MADLQTEPGSVGLQPEEEKTKRWWNRRIASVVLAVAIVLLVVAVIVSSEHQLIFRLFMTQVPRVDPNYSLDVQSWWAANPLNPENPDGIPIGAIGSPIYTINVQTQFDGNTQKALAALPPNGGTLYFPPGIYSPFQLVGRSHVHFIGTHGATIRGHSSVYGCPQVPPNAFTRQIVSGDRAALQCLRHPIHDLYFFDLTFDGGGAPTSALDISASRDIVLDRVTFQNYTRQNTSDAAGLLNVDHGSDNVWCRGCSFDGSHRMAAFMNGVHGGGVVNSRFGPGFYASWLVFGTDGDTTTDLNGDGRIEQGEQRASQYVVVADNQLTGPAYEAVIISGQHTLIENNRETGSLYLDFARYETECSGPEWPGGLVYDDHDHQVIGNQIDATPLFVQMDGLSATHDCQVKNIGRLGDYTIEGNIVTGAPPDFRLVVESGSIDGPRRVRGNCVNDLICALRGKEVVDQKR